MTGPPADPAQLASLISPLPARIGVVAYESEPTGFGLARKRSYHRG